MPDCKCPVCEHGLTPEKLLDPAPCNFCRHWDGPPVKIPLPAQKCSRGLLCWEGLRHCHGYAPILYATRFERVLREDD